MDLRKDKKYCEKTIFYTTEQLLLEKGPQAKAAFKKIQEDSSPNLTKLKDYIHDQEKSAPILSHKTFLKIHDNTALPDNSIIKVAKIIREDAGNRCIEANLEKELKNHGKQCEKFFSTKQIDMIISEKVYVSHISQL